MTMGLPCDSDGYDLRIDQCRQCGSRGCPRKHECKTKEVDLADVFGYGPSAPGWKEPSTPDGEIERGSKE